jgi:hypothetical protein
MEGQITHCAVACDRTLEHYNYQKSNEIKEDKLIFIYNDSQ